MAGHMHIRILPLSLPWISPAFKFYIVRDYQQLKEQEQKTLGWSAKRELAKINYHIHTDAIKEHLVPQEIDPYHRALIYANEAYTQPNSHPADDRVGKRGQQTYIETIIPSPPDVKQERSYRRRKKAVTQYSVALRK